VFSPRSGSSAGSQQCSSYCEILNESLLGEGYETAISVTISPDSSPQHIKSLSAELLCTNGRLTETLRIRDIRQHTQTSLNFVTLTNCTPVTRTYFTRIGDNRLWRLLGMQFINLKHLTAGSLRSALKLCSISDGQGRQSVMRSKRHIEGIRSFIIEGCDSLINQIMKRGWSVNVTLDPDCFCSPGDMHLFGAMIDQFLSAFVAEGYFLRTIIQSAHSGIEYGLAARMGRRMLV
jgi:type VI secretion system protein ImpG